MLSPVRLFVCQMGGSHKTVKARIMKFSPYGSPIPIVFAGLVSSRNSKGFPRAGASNKAGVGKISSFLSLSVNISKNVADTAKLQLMTNRKSHMGFP